MIVVTFVALYFGLQTRPMPDRTSSLPWVGKYNASALIRRQVQLVEDGMVTALSNYADQEAALIKQLQDENKALKEKLETKDHPKEQPEK